MRRISTLFFAMTTLLLSSSAWADATGDFTVLMKDFVSIAQSSQNDCEAQTRQLQEFLDKSETTFTDLAPLLAAAGEPDTGQQALLEGLLVEFDAATKECSTAQATMGKLIQMLQSAPSDAPDEAMDFSDDPDATADADPPSKTEAVPAKTKAKPAPKKPEPPAAADVKLMCDEWRESVADYKHDCSALGKRLQRQFNALDYELADIPTFGDHRKALINCNKAVEEMGSCVEHREMESAFQIFGKF